VAQKNWEPGQSSFEVRWVENDRFWTEEFGELAEAEALAHDRLDEGACSTVSIVKWRHFQNLPGALPLVRASSISLTNYTLGPDGKLVEKPVDIHGVGY
jgi:hypothetical protein